MFFFGAMSFPLYSISLAHANDNSKLSPVETGSVILLTYSLGSVIGPLLLSATLPISNFGLYYLTLATFTPFAIITFLRTRRIPATQAHFMPYQDVPVTTQEAIVLGTEDESTVRNDEPLFDSSNELSTGIERNRVMVG
jgi:hypothetical protein